MSKEKQKIHKDKPFSQSSTYNNPQIEENAQKYGYKAANLINLRDVVAEFVSSEEGRKLEQLHGKITIDVPTFKQIDANSIQSHLDHYALEWRDLFKKFQDSFAQQQDKNRLSNETIECGFVASIE